MVTPLRLERGWFLTTTLCFTLYLNSPSKITDKPDEVSLSTDHGGYAHPHLVRQQALIRNASRSKHKALLLLRKNAETAACRTLRARLPLHSRTTAA